MRNRSMALAVRDGRILMIQTLRRGRFVRELPGGGIEKDETAEQAAIRELKEECGVDGTVIRPLNTICCKDGSVESVFLVSVPDGQEAVTGTDPEIPDGKEQRIKDTGWMRLDELSERDRAFLWSCGLMEVEGFYDLVLSWGDDISYPEG